ncbi:MtrB/PioB family outer membrane beta-barrel protein [Candidatus Magnetomonas plexicatena]|uniref:MtrB/PioB family outer membrane beta-barrel protein n=1 Tax=Candidatus Magnetomonas plexicatena TaxID=2552947 RepID=UPI001C742413|nr:MtrB/PioB family outer membrane beta-barrel protein [Nitrospirales bacterium LBB_01]
MIRELPIKAVLAIFLMLLPISATFAQNAADSDNNGNSMGIPNLSGEITMTGQTKFESGNMSKYNEYKDTNKTNFFGDIKLKYDDDKYWFYLKAEDIGYDTQHYKLEGGIYGIVKYNLEYNEMPHNYSLGDRTIYSGAGSNNLTTISGFSKTPQSRWNTIDYSIDRQLYGGGVRLDAIKPFYVEFSTTRETRSGTRPISVTNSNGSSGPVTEFPQPIDYITESVKGEAGYITRPLFASVYLQYTDFTNNNTEMYFQNIYTGSSTIPNRAGQTDTLTLPPNNENYNYGFKGSVALPLNSRLNVSLSGSDTTSDARYLTSSVIGATTTVRSPMYSYIYSNGNSNWHGKVDTQNYSFVLTTNPIYDLNASVFYKYRSLQNKSDNPTATSSTGDTNTYVPVSYNKSDTGVDLSYRLPTHFILTGGYNYVITHNSIDINYGVNGAVADGAEQMTYDIPTTTDNIWNIGVKWAGVDFMSAKVGYERMNRDGSNDSSIYAAADRFAQYKNEFDTGSQKRDKIKVSVNFFPIETLDIGLGYNYKKSTYPDTVIGLRDSRNDEYYVDAGYTFGKVARLNGYLAYEDLKTYQFMRTANTTAGNDPNGTTQNSTNYNWDLTLRDKSFDYGANVDFYLVPKKVTLRVQYDSARSDGSGDFTILNQAALNTLGSSTPSQNNSNIDISNIDNYRRNTFLTKILWNITKSFTVALGYAYEHYKYDDYAYNNYPYTYTIKDSSGNVTYLTGAYSDPSYNASLAFLTLKYSFK